MSVFTSANAAAKGAAGGAAKARNHRASAIRQVVELKTVAHRDAISDKTPVAIRASLMRAYVDLQEIDMALRGYGKPKTVEARNGVRKVKTTLRAEPTSKGEATEKPTSASESKGA